MTPGKQRLFYPSVEYGQTMNEVKNLNFLQISSILLPYLKPEIILIM